MIFLQRIQIQKTEFFFWRGWGQGEGAGVSEFFFGGGGGGGLVDGGGGLE